MIEMNPNMIGKRKYERPKMQVVELGEALQLLTGSQVIKGKDFDGWDESEDSSDNTILDEE